MCKKLVKSQFLGKTIYVVMSDCDIEPTERELKLISQCVGNSDLPAVDSAYLCSHLIDVFDGEMDSSESSHFVRVLNRIISVFKDRELSRIREIVALCDEGKF
jgi:hypothetical protein